MKNNQITSLRGVLILIIMFYHYTFRFHELFGIDTIDFPTLKFWGTIGVAGFFIISGYYIFPKYTDKYSIKEYLIKKIIRLWPVYVLGITLTFISVSLFGLENREIGFLEYITNVFFINGFVGINYVDGAHWYITYLLLFSVIASAILYIESKMRINRKTTILIWISINALLGILAMHFAWADKVYMITGGKYLLWFAIGIVLRKVFDDKDSKHNNLLCIIMGVVIVCQLIYKENYITILGGAVCLILFLLALNNKLRILDIGVLRFIGDRSYCIYIIHQNIGYQLILLLIDYFEHYSIVHVFLVGLAIIFIADLIYRYYEKPIKKKIEMHYTHALNTK